MQNTGGKLWTLLDFIGLYWTKLGKNLGKFRGKNFEKNIGKIFEEDKNLGKKIFERE